ncbi:divalent-cation tolerance protein CutA [Candidatus Woesearchaeota archaeon]|nr:divalent-cation tolerance protein CutA [Candidatus Woesearchaeota archaeon]
MIILYVTCKDTAQAKAIAAMLLKKRLIACANLFPITSMYEWKGKMMDDNEVVLLCKTTKNRADAAEREIKRVHSYKCPCIIKIPCKANKEYEQWIGEMVVGK